MEDFVEQLTRGNVVEVKVLLASVALALAVYQLSTIAVVYRRLRPRFLSGGAASWAHRATGDVIAALLVATAVMCVGYFGFESEHAAHTVSAVALLVVLTFKILVLRVWTGLGNLLPGLGITVFVLLGLTWATSAGLFLAGG